MNSRCTDIELLDYLHRQLPPLQQAIFGLRLLVSPPDRRRFQQLSRASTAFTDTLGLPKVYSLVPTLSLIALLLMIIAVSSVSAWRSLTAPPSCEPSAPRAAAPPAAADEASCLACHVKKPAANRASAYRNLSARPLKSTQR